MICQIISPSEHSLIDGMYPFLRGANRPVMANVGIIIWRQYSHIGFVHISSFRIANVHTFLNYHIQYSS